MSAKDDLFAGNAAVSAPMTQDEPAPAPQKPRPVAPVAVAPVPALDEGVDAEVVGVQAAAEVGVGAGAATKPGHRSLLPGPAPSPHGELADKLSTELEPSPHSLALAHVAAYQPRHAVPRGVLVDPMSPVVDGLGTPTEILSAWAGTSSRVARAPRRAPSTPGSRRCRRSPR